jgi:hypothetical protein
MTHLVRWLSRALPCVAVVTAACTEPAPEPPPEPPPLRTSPLAACADPAVALTPRWQVDNLHAPVTAIATSGATLVVGSADGAVKLWHLSTTGAIERRPGYGTPLREAGTTVAALAATADGALAAVDLDGAAAAWRLDGTPLGGAATSRCPVTPARRRPRSQRQHAGDRRRRPARPARGVRRGRRHRQAGLADLAVAHDDRRGHRRAGGRGRRLVRLSGDRDPARAAS